MRVLPAALLLVVLLPAAVAEPVLRVELSTDHPPDHVMMLDRETHRGSMPIHVKVHASGFVCAQPATVSVSLVVSNVPTWGGASPNPSTSAVTIDLAQPGLDEKVVTGPDGALDIDWGDPPATGAQVQYRIDSQTKIDGACLPGPTPTEGERTMTVAMPDVAPVETPRDPCAQAGADACSSPAVPEGTKGASSSWSVAASLAAAAGVALVRRR